MPKIGRVCKNLLGGEYGKKRKDFVHNVKILPTKIANIAKVATLFLVMAA